MINEILLRRKNKVTVNYEMTNTDNTRYVVTVMKNIQNLGFTFSKELIETLRFTSVDNIKDFYLELVPMLKTLVGADVEYNPMYPNFPQQVLEADEIELFINAIVHYWSYGTIMPEYKKDERLPLFDDVKLKVIDLGKDEDLKEIMNNLISSKTSLSQQDKEDMATLFSSSIMNDEDFPSEIPFKENVAEIGKLIIDNFSTECNKFKILAKYFKTATDLLRFAVRLSDGDTSLATNTKFKSFKRSERRLFIQLLENCGNIEEDMLRYEGQWIRLGEKLHPGEYPQYTKVNVAFDKLRNNKKIETFGGKVDAAIKNKKIDKAINYLKTRPGEFARMLDSLIRNNKGYESYIINEFANVANQISVPVLLQVKEHFDHRCENNDSRVFFPKGQLAKAYTIKNELEPIGEQICSDIVCICQNAIMEQFSGKEDMGKIYIADCMKNFIIPQSQRSASKAFKTITRGSRIPIGDATKCARAFIFWTNNDDNNSLHYESRIDVDLSACILDENFNYMEHISYTNLRSAKYQAAHSGDITNGGDPLSKGGKGVAEFIDIDIDSVVKYGGRYIIYQVYNYSGYKFSDMTTAMFGWMNREDVESGEIFEPSTVEQKMNLTAESTVAIPVIFDCVKREFIWCDMNLTINGMNTYIGGNNLESNLRGVAATCYGIVNMHKPSMYDLAVSNALVRGTIVEDRNSADTIFDIDTTKPVDIITTTTEIKNSKGEVIDTKVETKEVVKDVKIITPYDTDIWMSDML